MCISDKFSRAQAAPRPSGRLKKAAEAPQAPQKMDSKIDYSVAESMETEGLSNSTASLLPLDKPPRFQSCLRVVSTGAFTPSGPEIDRIQG